jgi:hypothetical protein
MESRVFKLFSIVYSILKSERLRVNFKFTLNKARIIFMTTFEGFSVDRQTDTHTRTHAHTSIYIYIYIYIAALTA